MFTIRNFPLLFLALILISCSKDDDTAETILPKIYAYQISYMHYPTSVMSQPGNAKKLVTLEYDAHGRVTKRKGGLVPINWATGYDYAFSDSLYEEITYQNNQITITKRSAFKNLTVNPDPKTVTVENGQITRIIKETTNFSTTSDTMYLYFNQNRLTRSVTKDRATILTKDYLFNSAGNLTEIKGLAINRFQLDTAFFQVETFSDYDNVPNPLKQLTMFDELFYRSLSNNNYRKYSMQRFSPDSIVVANSTRTWNLKYDSEGKVNFGE